MLFDLLFQIEAKELVPGDIVEVAVGSRIPADCRLLEKIVSHLLSSRNLLGTLRFYRLLLFELINRF